MSLVERIKLARTKLPTEDVWRNLNEGQRGRAILNVLDADSDKNGDTAVYDTFVSAHHKKLLSNTYIDLNFEYPILLELFDLAETL